MSNSGKTTAVLFFTHSLEPQCIVSYLKVRLLAYKCHKKYLKEIPLHGSSSVSNDVQLEGTRKASWSILRSLSSHPFFTH